MRFLLFFIISLAFSFPLNSWKFHSNLTGEETLEISFWLAPENPESLETAFWEISDPDHSRFRQYLTGDEMKMLVKPKQNATSSVLDWITETCGKKNFSWKFSQFEDYLKLQAQVTCIEELLELKLQMFQHDKTKRKIIRSVKKLEIPCCLQEFVQSVFGINEFLPIPEKKHYGKEPGDEITPPVIRAKYNIIDKGGRTSMSQGFASFEDAEFRQEDLNQFLQTYNLTAITIGVVGPNDGGYFGEATLDSQYILATGEGVPTWDISHEQFDLLYWCQMVLNMTNSPKVLSISWGSSESGYQLDHMTATNTEFMKMGTLGFSILTASGDGGTGKQGFFGCKKFDPNWPATSPYLTSVGGTYLQNDKEFGWTDSGGGFSAVFGMPDYQKTTVEDYLENTKNLPSSNLFNNSGRAIPDISAFATNFKLFSFNSSADISGTSASSPTLAGMVAVINDILSAAGQNPVGFLNPLLYKAGNVGFDVTEGNNKASGCKTGFPATTGWDAITGIGTPNYVTLKQTLMAERV